MRMSLLFLLGAVAAWQFWPEGGPCFGCRYESVERNHSPQTAEFHVTSDGTIGGVRARETHTYTLQEMSTLSGRSFGYSPAESNSHGEAGRIYYLPADRLQQYNDEFLKPGKECPSSWMHQNLKAHVLVGATDDLAKQLRAHRFKIEYGGSPYSYRGHPMTYASSLRHGKKMILAPPSHENAHSNVGYAETSYDYFLVTKIVRAPGSQAATLTARESRVATR